jgi:hypothetical protein
METRWSQSQVGWQLVDKYTEHWFVILSFGIDHKAVILLDKYLIANSNSSDKILFFSIDKNHDFVLKSPVVTVTIGLLVYSLLERLPILQQNHDFCQ